MQTPACDHRLGRLLLNMTPGLSWIPCHTPVRHCKSLAIIVAKLLQCVMCGNAMVLGHGPRLMVMIHDTWIMVSDKWLPTLKNLWKWWVSRSAIDGGLMTYFWGKKVWNHTEFKKGLENCEGMRWVGTGNSTSSCQLENFFVFLPTKYVAQRNKTHNLCVFLLCVHSSASASSLSLSPDL